MPKLFSASCGPLPILLLLLLASAPVMAWELMQVAESGEHLLVGLAEKASPYFLRQMKAREDSIKGWTSGFKTCKVVKKLTAGLDPGPFTVSVIPIDGTSPIRHPVVTADITATDAARHSLCGVGDVEVEVGFGSRGTQSLTPSIPGGTTVVYPAGGPPQLALLGFGNGGLLPKTYSNFAYRVGDDGRADALLPTATAPGRHLGEKSSQLATSTTVIPLHTDPKYPRDGDGRYYVEVSGIRVGDKVVRTSTKLGFRPDGTGGVYLSTMEPYTYLESCVYLGLKEELMSQIQRLNPGAAPTSLNPSDKLCYVRTELKVPSMAILFTGNAVMKLGAAANVWYREGASTICLAILPTNLSSPGDASVLGSWLQTGRMMTIDVTHGTLTF